MKELIFATGNPLKFAIAQKALEGTDIVLIQQKLDLPEIQSEDSKEIASFSAKWGSNLLKKPIVVSDAGYYIEALNGFPRPIHQIYQPVAYRRGSATSYGGERK